MIAWINFATLVVCILLGLYFSVKDAGPALGEKNIEAIASAKSTRYRTMASVLMTVAGMGYVFYFLYPLPVPLPRTFPWSWSVSALISTAIAIVSGYLWWRSMNEVETARVPNGKLEEKITHSEAGSQLTFWWAIAFLLHSPFLVLFSLIWIPILAIESWLQKRNLLVSDGKANQSYILTRGALIH